MFNWFTYVTLVSFVLFLALCNADTIDVAELQRIFRSSVFFRNLLRCNRLLIKDLCSNPSAMARFQELFGSDGLSLDSGRLSNLQRLG
ncbi:hypothetical protein ANCDUO_09872 [Ancylostoma duodenale]|uniref:Receptor L-domain domain-containing protein n=1 Tax=Ancylostoma duodenale TaxID=51022 RepID=A0A0C2DBV4_9BILA|nr:hypothetical protein ANCDUO_09872 [Ancylostoma duodenale]